MKSKRGQAALEFLMTYGWSILVVLVVASGLSYYGVLNPDLLVSDECSFSNGLGCNDFLIDLDGSLAYNGNDFSSITLVIKNTIGKPINILWINATPKDSGLTINCHNNSRNNPVTGEVIKDGEMKQFFLNCSEKVTYIDRKSKFDIAVNFYFNNTNMSYNHTIKGDLISKVEP